MNTEDRSGMNSLVFAFRFPPGECVCVYTTTTAKLRFIFRENTKGSFTLEQSQCPNKALFRESPQKPVDTHAQMYKHTHTYI